MLMACNAVVKHQKVCLSKLCFPSTTRTTSSSMHTSSRCPGEHCRDPAAGRGSAICRLEDVVWVAKAKLFGCPGVKVNVGRRKVDGINPFLEVQDSSCHDVNRLLQRLAEPACNYDESS